MKTMLITGAAGFIGNAACLHYRDRYEITGVDDMSRPTAKAPEGVTFIEADALNAWTRYDVIIHLAAQVSVTNSLADPINDFHRNAALTLWLARCAAQDKVEKFVYASTNKIYGERIGQRYPVLDIVPICPETPYGISKAAGGLYVRDMLPSTGYDFRQSCIYGEDQQGTEDQGWIGWLRRSIADGREIVCYGDGSQVRDLLHVSDLLRAYDLALGDKLTAGSYVVGGGLSNSVTFAYAVALMGGRIARYKERRPHDQEYFVSANQGLRQAGWEPKVNSREWLQKQRKEILSHA